MIAPDAFLDDLARLGLTDFFGVPDSLLAPLNTAIETRAGHGTGRIEITADEGAAIGMAIGTYLGTGTPAVVFMQNSGLGNAVNPLTSLTSPKVYGIPMLMLIGWRGEMTEAGQLKDEPQHVYQGEITCDMLDLLDIPYRVIGPDDSADTMRQHTETLLHTAQTALKPAALVIRKGTFSAAPKTPKAPAPFPTREDAIATALAHLPDTPLVATTGKISREVYELQQAHGTGGPAFLSVGGMGHAVMIATGLAQTMPDRKIACFDGDGAVLMHAGSLATAARQANLIHLVFNNQVHDSVGGQTTAGPDADLATLATAMGFKSAQRITTLDALGPALQAAQTAPHASFIEIMVAPGARADLGRPKATPADSKTAFMTAIGHLHD